MTKILRAIAAVALVVAGLAVVAGPASAQQGPPTFPPGFPPGPPPGVPPQNPPGDAPGYQLASLITPPQAAVRGAVTSRCVGFPPDTPVTFSLDGEVLGTVTADANGDCAFTFTMPDACGVYTLTASGGGVVRTSTITVPCAAAPVSAAGALPYTGSDSLPIAQLGIGLLAVGAFVTILVRRRHAAPAIVRADRSR